MNKLFIVFILGILFSFKSEAQTISLSFDASNSREKYSSAILAKALSEKGYSITAQAAFKISLEINTSIEKEAFTIFKSSNEIRIKGGDENGILYGCFSVAEDIRTGIPIEKIKEKSENPRLQFRAIKYDLPWDTYRHSYALDQHQETCADVKYWESFLNMMAENRFNVLTLWNLHPYTFMIKPAHFPEASPWSEDEMKKWKILFGSIFKMAEERGIDTYVVPFNIFVTKEFSRAHNVAMDNLDHHFFVKGDTSEIVKQYTRECVTQLLEEYPELDGIGMTLGEGMGGMTPQQRENWMKETIIAGMRNAKRKSKVIHRIPFSSTTGSLSPTSIETEIITRRGIEQEAAMNFIEQPVWADLKFNWSHPLSTTKLIKVHGGKLFGGYWTPEPTSFKIVWTARNEDIFCLRWGVPSFIREHIKTNALGYVGGYVIGSETYIPAKDYFTKPGINREWKYAFERQWLFYKIWGRLLYNPSTPDEVFKNEFVNRYGNQAVPLFEASSLAGTTPLRLASAFDFTWDFSLYAEGFLALNSKIKRVEFISIDRLINQPTLDPDYVSVVDYVKGIAAGEAFDKKVTPLKLAELLNKDCTKALNLIKSIKLGKNVALQHEVSDIRTWANLGLYFSEKLKGAIALQTYRTKGNEADKKDAIHHLENALKFWDVVIGITTPLYNDMPLVHLSEQDGKPWKENDNLRFHWRLLRDDVKNDIEVARSSTSTK
ncbi:MAG TPA: hypothetical protein VGQ59_12825 [Cyclobacteriaceae bacterium]|jgi:hypothetical protein|nr:hypothetical protein [Cyclobacteriaceae bacterium]